MPAPTCSLCARAADPLTDGDPPLGWTVEVEPAAGATPGRTTWVCPSCTREHVRAIEAKLDQQWW